MSEVAVTVCCITYNHAKFVRQCLNSIVEQKTDFTFEILIHDDASTDGTADIIREYIDQYPELFVPMIEKENQYSQGKRSILIQLMLKKARGRYIAVCEGDDFWCERHKLQKQFNFLQKHKNCNMCTHAVEVIKENGSSLGRIIPQRNIPCGEMGGKTLINFLAYEDTHLFHTSSMFFEKKAIVDDLEEIPSFLTATAAEDRALFLYYAVKGNVFYTDEVMSKYRVQSEGSWSLNNSQSKQHAHRTDKELMKMINDFDEYTQGRFEKETYAYQTLLNFRIFQYERRYKELLDIRYAKLFQGLRKKQKVYYKICAYFPFIGDLYYKIKKEKRDLE